MNLMRNYEGIPSILKTYFRFIDRIIGLITTHEISFSVKSYSVKNCVEKKPSFFNILPCKALPKLCANQIVLIFLLENCHPWSTIVYCKNEFSLKLWIMNRKPTSNTWNVFTINTVTTSFDEDPELSNQYLT